jgi:hypothetical protein
VLRGAFICVDFGFWEPVAVGALAGCATMSKEACLQGDWAGVGFKDGEAGRPQSRLDEHAKACAKSGVVPDAAPYFQAREQGLKLYCTQDRGFGEGRNGNAYPASARRGPSAASWSAMPTASWSTPRSRG